MIIIHTYFLQVNCEESSFLSGLLDYNDNLFILKHYRFSSPAAHHNYGKINLWVGKSEKLRVLPMSLTRLLCFYCIFLIHFTLLVLKEDNWGHPREETLPVFKRHSIMRSMVNCSFLSEASVQPRIINNKISTFVLIVCFSCVIHIAW